MAHAQVNGIDVSYYTDGTGIPCLVPRALNTSIMERTLSPRLRDYLQFVFFDFRSSGQSGGAPGEFTLDQLLADVEQLRQVLGFQQVALIGWSIMALVAIDFAKTYPDSLSHLILIGGATHAGHRDDRYWELLASDERKASLAANYARLDQAVLAALPAGKVAPLQYAANGPRFWYDASFNCLPLYADDEWDMTFWDRVFAECQVRHPDASVIEGVTTPTFLAEGVWDFNCPPIDWHDVIKTYPNCAYHAFERSGHYPFYEEQELFDAKLIGWLTESRPLGRPPA